MENTETTTTTQDIVRLAHEGLVTSGVNFAVYLPDSVFYPLTQTLEADKTIQTVVCSREDEGIAIAAGAYLGGKVPVVLMESSGLGFSGLVLARTQLQRTPMLLLAGHSKTLGIHWDFFGASRITGEGILQGLGIPYVVVDDPANLNTFIKQAVVTMKGQKTAVGLVIPRYIMGGV